MFHHVVAASPGPPGLGARHDLLDSDARCIGTRSSSGSGAHSACSGGGHGGGGAGAAARAGGRGRGAAAKGRCGRRTGRRARGGHAQRRLQPRRQRAHTLCAALQGVRPGLSPGCVALLGCLRQACPKCNNPEPTGWQINCETMTAECDKCGEQPACGECPANLRRKPGGALAVQVRRALAIGRLFAALVTVRCHCFAVVLPPRGLGVVALGASTPGACSRGA